MQNIVLTVTSARVDLSIYLVRIMHFRPCPTYNQEKVFLIVIHVRLYKKKKKNGLLSVLN